MYWKVSQGIEAQVLASADAVKLLGILDKRPEVPRAALKDEARIAGKRFDEALRVLEVAGRVILDDAKIPDRRGRLREQKLVRLVNPPTGDRGTTGDTTRDKPLDEDTDQPGTDHRGSPWLDGSVQENENPQPGTGNAVVRRAG